MFPPANIAIVEPSPDFNAPNIPGTFPPVLASSDIAILAPPVELPNPFNADDNSVARIVATCSALATSFVALASGYIPALVTFCALADMLFNAVAVLFVLATALSSAPINFIVALYIRIIGLVTLSRKVRTCVISAILHPLSFIYDFLISFSFLRFLLPVLLYIRIHLPPKTPFRLSEERLFDVVTNVVYVNKNDKRRLQHRRPLLVFYFMNLVRDIHIIAHSV